MAEVLHSVSPHESQVYLAADPIRHTPSPRPPYVIDRSAYEKNKSMSIYPESTEDTSSSSHSSTSSSPLQKPIDYTIRSPLHSTPPSSISLDTKATEDDLYFPSYNDTSFDKSTKLANPPPGTPVHEDDVYDASASSTTDSTAGTESSNDSVSFPPVADDTAVRKEPSRQVDYLSHDWREEDIWSSWRHIVSRRSVYGERSRLENASWRSWAKSKYHLRTVSPKTLNWSKESDVTWLYGPLQESQEGRAGGVESISCISKAGPTKKPILKKRTISEVMLQNSISSSSLVKQAATAVQAQRSFDLMQGQVRINGRPKLGRAQSDFTGTGTQNTFNLESSQLPAAFASMSSSGVESPEASGKKHIRFDDKVEQCIAVDFQPGTGIEDEIPKWQKDTDDSSDEELMMNLKPKRQPSSTSSQRSSFGHETKGIAMLPSTKLKYHQDEPACPGHPETVFTPSWEQPIPKSASQETLRPSKPSSNFLIGEADDAEDDIPWEPSGAFGNLRKDSMAAARTPIASPTSWDGDEKSFDSIGGMRRSPSGMFLPLDDDDDETPFATTGLFGRVVDTVNTARDIAHVIWNVGWRK